MINIGQYIETAINWLTNHFATFFDTLSIGIGGFIDSFQHVLYGIPFYNVLPVSSNWDYPLSYIPARNTPGSSIHSVPST